MKPVIWAAISGAVGLAWITMESVIGMHADDTSYATTMLWLIIPPVCSIGAMAHQRMNADTLTYGQVLKTGFLTAIYGGLVLGVVWFIVAQVLAPDYPEMMIRSVAAKSIAAGEDPLATAQRVKMGRMLFDDTTILLLGGLMPVVTGSIASLVAALGLQKRRS